MGHLLDIFLLQGGFIHQFIEWIINNGGLYILLLVVFAETGLFVGFFLPGDALLFAAGIYLDQLAAEFFGFPFYFVLILVILASILGNMVGYWFGRKTGPLLFERKDTWLFRRKHMLRAKSFYDNYGKATIFLAKFLPIIRTFAPIVAGVVKMERPTFLFYNMLGSIAWVCSMMLSGYFLEDWIQGKFGFSLKDHIETITIGIILVTTVPVLYKLLFAKKHVIPADDNDKECYTIMDKKQPSLFNVAVIVAALGYFVDIYDLLLFTIVREPSLVDIDINKADTKAMIAASTKIINWQMIGLLIGGIVWGVMGDKKGRLSVLFGSILLYSTANFLTGYVTTLDQYAYARFVAGIGLAGELGAGITLVSELLPKSKRGIGTSLVAGIGLFGAVFAYFTFKYTNEDWRLCYKIGGGLGIGLLLLRIGVAESGMFKEVKEQGVSRGNLLMFFTNGNRFRKYLLAILIGLPTWYVIGILVNLSNRFAAEFYGTNAIESGRAIMYAYVGIALGDIIIGFVSQYFKSRKKALYLFYALTIISGILFFSAFNTTDDRMYAICAALGFSTGFWAIFVTMGAEQFGTNLRATAATTIPNIVRGALPLMNMLFKNLFQDSWGWSLVKSGIVTGIVVIIITLLAAFFTEETFGKDLNYIEQ